MDLRLSYSIINLWLQGDYEGAIQAIHGKWREPNEYMKYGTEKHAEWEKYVKENETLPAEFGSMKLKDFTTEEKKVIKVLDWLTLSGVIDLSYVQNGKKHIVDYKTGKSSASAYASSLQHKVYKVLFKDADIFEYMHWNQYTQTATVQRIHLTEETFEEGLNTIITVACDIRATMENMGEYNG